MDTKHGVFDYLVGEGTDPDGYTVTDPYTIFSNTSSSGKTWWPWDDPPYHEARDPTHHGVIAIPGYEMHFGVHTYAFFSTASEGDVRGRSGVPEKHQDVVDNSNRAEGKPEAIVGFAHVGRYLDGSTMGDATNRQYELFRFNTERLAKQEVPLLVGSGRNSRPFPNVQPRELWDRLLTEFAPEYIPLKTAHNDPYGDLFETGYGLDVRYVSVLLDADDFDPNDQQATRSAARETMATGGTLVHLRDEWDPVTEDPPAPPMVTDAGVENGVPFVESDADSQAWITADGTSAGTGESPDMSAAKAYLRCELWDSDGSALTLTQPWGIAPSRR